MNLHNGINWKLDENWPLLVKMVLRYFRKHDLKYGDIAIAVIDEMCSSYVCRRTMLMSKFSLTSDGLATILSNVTMAIQKEGKVYPPHDGGWYFNMNNQELVVAPGFADAWKALRLANSS